MNSKLFWKTRMVWQKCQFVMRKAVFRVSHRVKHERRTVSFSFLLFKMVLLQIVKGIVWSSIFFLGDFFLFPILKDRVFKDNFLTLNTEIVPSIILGSVGVAGVILGLYCSNIASTFSSKYANAPSNLISIFQRDIIANKCVQQIVAFIILCFLLLGECVFGVNLSYVSLLAVIILSIRTVVIFAFAGNRTNLLANTYQISENIYPEILDSIKYISRKHFYAKDKSFQNHFQKTVSRKLKDLEDISFYNKDNPPNQNAATLLFASKNMNLLKYYWSVKSDIRYDSLWYRDKMKYPPWHSTSDIEISIALQTGTSPEPKAIRDYWWIERDIEKINEICFDKLCRDGDFETILKYVDCLAMLSSYAVDSGDILSWVHIVTGTQNQFISLCLTPTLDSKENQTVAAICVAFVGVFISLLIGINGYLRELNLSDLLDNIARASSITDADNTSNMLFNNKDMDDILRMISVEMKLEGKRITPDWYVKQIASKSVVSFLNEILECIVVICDTVIKFGTPFLEKRQFFYGASVFAQFVEFIYKSQITITAIEKNFDILQGQDIEPTIVWEEEKLSLAKQKMEKVKRQLPQLLIKCSGGFALMHLSKRENYPDLLGFCYNHICETLISSIETNDFETFQESYSGFLGLMFFYQEYVREDVIKIREPHRQEFAIQAFAKPFIDYAMISGFAILWGEFNRSPQWKELVNNELQQYIEKDTNNILVLKRITELVIDRKRSILGIGNNGILRINWKQRIIRAIVDSDLCEYEYDNFGPTVLKSDSMLLKAFITSSFLDLGFTHDVEDIFFICCVNRYLPEESKYKSRFRWEDRLNEQ